MTPTTKAQADRTTEPSSWGRRVGGSACVQVAERALAAAADPSPPAGRTRPNPEMTMRQPDPLTGRRTSDAGFSLVELLVVMIVVGLLAAVSVPVFRDQQRKSLDRTVVADLNRYEVAADRLFSATYAYPVTNTGFDLHDRGDPDASSGNTFRAFTVPSGANAGYVVYGQNSTTGSVFALSSYSGGKPAATALTSLPTAPPMAGTLTVTAGVVAADWSSLPGLTWGAVPAGAATRIHWPDATFLTPALGITAVPNLGGYFSAPYRLVELASPVASRAVEVTTNSTSYRQGLIFWQQTSWAGAVNVAVAGESWTTSAWVKGPASLQATIGVRVTSATGVGLDEPGCTFTATGDWQRVACTKVSMAAWAGGHVSVQVINNTPATGVVFWVTAPQVDRGAVASPFSLG